MDIRKIIRESILEESREERQLAAFDKWCFKTLKNDRDWVNGYREDYDEEFGNDNSRSLERSVFGFRGYGGKEISFEEYLTKELSTSCRNKTELKKEWLTYKNQMEHSDIFQYKEWRGFLDDLRGAKEKSFTKKLKTSKEGEDYDKIYEDGDTLVIVPLTHVGSCKYGQGTKWCTTSKDNPSYFNAYTKRATLYRILQKNNNFTDKPNVDKNLNKVSIQVMKDNKNLIMFDAENKYYSNEKDVRNFLSKLPDGVIKSIKTHQKTL
jgi:hypothetical protein